MITTKEYPATHSMSTSWFGIDNEGNVAIFDFKDNGPVPDGVPESSPESVICEEFVDRNVEIPYLEFDDDQVGEILNELVDFKGDEDLYCGIFSTIIQVDLDRLEEFEFFVKKCNEEVKKDLYWKTILLNKKHGFYIVNTADWEEIRIDELLRSGLVKKKLTYELSIWFNDKWDVEKKQDYFEVIFFNLPFFAFAEPYWPSFPMEKVYVPRYPLKADKLPKEALKKAFHFDFSFNDVNNLQIARYFPFRMHYYEDGESVDGIDGVWLPINDKEDGLLLDSSIPQLKKEELITNGDESYVELKNPGVRFDPSQATFHPKYIRLTLCREYHEDSPLREVNGNLARLPIISLYPIPYDEVSKRTGDFSLWDIEREITYNTEIIKERLRVEKPFLETNINLFRPYLLILSNASVGLLKDFFHITEDSICIGEYTYRYVICDVLRPNSVSFDEWEKLPYRGKVSKTLIKKRAREND